VSTILFNHLRTQIETTLSAAEHAEGENKRVLLRRMRMLLLRADQALLVEGNQTPSQEMAWGNLRSLAEIALEDGERNAHGLR